MSLAIRLFGSDRRCLLLLVPLSLVLFATDLGGRDLWAPDEPRSGEVVREILLTGSWAALHDNGEPYLEKPPLYFWMAAAVSLALGGVNELAVRFPSSLAALLGVVATFYMGRGLFGRRAGALGAVVLATTQKYFSEARWAHPDMVWAVMLTVAALAYHQAWRTGGGRRWLVAFYLAVGLAALTKGPLGLLLPALAVLTFLLAIREAAFLRRSGIAWGVPLALLPSALWLTAYRVSTGGPFPIGTGLARIEERFVRGIHHPRPWIHFVTSLCLDTLPWLVFLPAAIVHTFPSRRASLDRESVYLYSWVTVILGVFALSAEKRGVYLLPLLPLLALLVGRVWDTALLDWDPSPVGRAIGWALTSALVLGIGGASFFLSRIERQLPEMRGPSSLLAGAVLLTVLLALAAHWRWGGGTGMALFAGGMAVCYVVIALAVLPALDHFKSARPFCARVAAAAADAPLGIFPDYRAAYAFYTRRRLEVLSGRDALRTFLQPGRRAYCLIEDDAYERERAALGPDLQVVDREQIGHRGMLLVAPGPAPAESPSPGTGGKR